MALFSKDKSSHHKRHPIHMAHCVDYIRQALMCSGDMSLEPVNRVTGNDGELGDIVVSGMEATHTCRNWDVVFGFANKWTLDRLMM